MWDSKYTLSRDWRQKPVNDCVKGRGYGRRAEELAVGYAIHVLGMTAVNADTLAGNLRSQHVLEKVGFRFVRAEGDFRYYRYEP